jgi:hypothetical protein
LITLRPALGADPELAALLADSVELVEEDHARRVPPCRLEDLVQPGLALAEPHVQHVVKADG